MTNSAWEQAAEKAIQRIAEREGTTAAHIYGQMQAAIWAGVQNTDPAIQARWRLIPRKGGLPTPEELIIWICQQTSK